VAAAGQALGNSSEGRHERTAVVAHAFPEAVPEDITPELARRSGFPSVVDALKTAKHGAGERVFVIDFHYDAKSSARETADRQRLTFAAIAAKCRAAADPPVS
jgi:hypothetical protein